MEYPYLDTEKHEFHANENTVFTLIPISVMSLIAVRGSKIGKPVPPEIDMQYAGGKTRKEKNPYDPGYLEAIKEWETEKQLSLTKYIVSFGIKESPPDEIVNSYKEISDFSNTEIKYMWVCSLVDLDNFGKLVEAILGQNTVTDKGLEVAGDAFPGEG